MIGGTVHERQRGLTYEPLLNRMSTNHRGLRPINSAVWLLAGLLVGTLYGPLLLNPTLYSGSERSPQQLWAGLQAQYFDGNPLCLPSVASPDVYAEYGSLAVKSSRLYEGTGLRVQRALLRASQGKPLRIGVMGGSITTGHGCPDPTYKSLWHNQLEAWAKAQFPSSNVTKYAASKPGTGAEFFAYCHGSVLPPELDLVVIETAVNDWEWNMQALTDYELLVRGLLDRPNPPAIISLSSFTLFKTLTGGDTQLVLANYYDYPVIGSRPAIYSVMLANSSTRTAYFGDISYGDHIDGGHPRCVGHKLLADLLTSYLAEQLCLATHPSLVIEAPESWPFYRPSDEPKEVPRIPTRLAYSPDHVEPAMTPTCISLEHAYAPLVEPRQSDGFEVWTMPGSNGEKVFYRGQKPGDSISFDIDLRRGSESSLFLYRFISKKWDLGEAECWIDEHQDQSVVISGYWEEQTSIGKTQRIPVPKDMIAGPHVLHCKVLDSTQSPDAPQGRNFFIIGVFAG